MSHHNQGTLPFAMPPANVSCFLSKNCTEQNDLTNGQEDDSYLGYSTV
jgi:hypothetical protein